MADYRSSLTKSQAPVKAFQRGVKPGESCKRGKAFAYCLPNGYWFCCGECASHMGKLSGVVRRAQTAERDMEIVYHRMLGVPVNELAEEFGLHRNTITNIFRRDAHKLLTLWQTLRQAAFRKLERAAHIVRNAVWRAGKIRDALMHNEQSYHQGGIGAGNRIVREVDDSSAIIDRIARGKRRYRRKYDKRTLENQTGRRPRARLLSRIP